MKRPATQHDDDIVIHSGSSPEEVHQAMLTLWARAKGLVASREPEWTDADGEIRERRWRLTFAEDRDSKSVRQIRFYWGAVLAQITHHDHKGRSSRQFHEVFKETVLGWEVVTIEAPGKPLQTIRRLRSTTGLSVKQMSEYLDEVIALAVTELGVEFRFNPREREAVRWVKATRKPQAAQPEAVAA